ncbi:hypothetical protein WR25_21138 isoform B [Diploscapter pachys]|uniref:lysoplasmalogenase n=1 Tax=Diploscapter pachys TaxID=2018661 RepID=A0A2A2L9N4_9BILA|nr:hypothetical protein WR25_21138 isoform B [Diploscapter pachys]
MMVLKHKVINMIISWFPDFFFYFSGIAPEGLVLAAVSFGIGHIFYMTQFFGNPITLHRPSLWTICAWNTFVGIVCLVPWLLEHFVGVSILILYSFLLSATLVVSISQYVTREPNEDPHPLLVRLIGFGLFYFSDSILIIGRTLWRFPHTDVLCLSTYYAAQYFILYANILHSFAKKLQ